MLTIKDWLLHIELGVVAALTAAAMARPGLLPAAALAGVLFWLLRLLQGRRAWRTPGDLPLLVLLLAASVSLLISPLPAETQVQSWRLLNGLGLYGALAAWGKGTARLRWAAAGLSAASAGLAFYALIGVAWSGDAAPGLAARLYRLLPAQVSDTANPNVMAGALVYLLPVPLALALFGMRAGRPRAGAVDRLLPVLFGLAGLWSAAVLVLTYSRGAMLAAAAAGLVLVVLRWRRGWLALLAALLVVAAAALWLGVDRLAAEVVASATLGGSEGRGEVWTRAVYMLQDFPLTGIGLGAFNHVADLLYPFFRYPPGAVGHAHNLFMQVGIDLGLPGLVGWMAMYLLALWLSWRVYRAGKAIEDFWIAGLGAGLLAGQVALGLHGLVDAVTWGMVRPAPLVWGVWGIVMAAAYQADSRLHAGVPAEVKAA